MRRRGVSLVEVVVVALIAGTSMVYVLSLGQANVRLSGINQEGLLARQIATDVLEYFATHVHDAREVARPDALPGSWLPEHPVLGEGLASSEPLAALYRRMDPRVTLELATDVGDAGLHRLTCSVRWSGRELRLSRLVAEAP